MGTVIGGLLLPQFKPYDLGGTLEQANRIAGGQTTNQTALLTLADLKAKQQAEQLFLERIKNDPALAQQLLGGGSVLGSLGTATAPPGGAPMTQQQLMPGQPPGAPQMVPGGQDLSQFATQGGPPQSVLGSLGPAGQAQMQAPRNPVLEMAATNPRAAMMMQQQMQQQQDFAFKRQEQQLGMGVKVMESLGQMAQGVTDQAGWDQLRQDAAQISPQLAARVEPVYSKEGKARLIAQATGVKDSLTLQVQDLAAQAAVIKARKEGRSTEVDNELIAMGVQPGQERPDQMRAALDMVKQGKKEVSAVHGTGQIVQTPTGYVRIKPGTDQVEELKGPGGEPLQPKPTQAEQETASYSNLARQGNEGATALEKKGFTPGFWAKSADKLPLGIGNYLTSDDHQKYKDYVMDFAQAWLRRTSKGAITETEWKFVDERYFPQPGNSQAQVEQKRVARKNVIKELEAEGKGTGRTGTQAQAQDQSSAGTAKPVSQMNADETRAEIAAIKARGGS